MRTRIRGGRVIDPARGIDAIGDVLIDGDRIVSETAIPGSSETAVSGVTRTAAKGARHPAASTRKERVIDAAGCVVMAGGIDLHTHIGGGKVTLARLLLGDQFRPSEPQETEWLPAAAVAGRRYLEMGYTTCFEPAVIPSNARSAHAEMADVTGIDTGGYCLLGNDELLLRMIAERVPQARINDYVAWMVRATQAIAVKVVNPGGISAFKFNGRHLDVDTPHPEYGVTPGAVIRTLCRAVHEIGLVHPPHVHCSNLGIPGNIESTLATIRAADGLPIHLTHVQFHAYGSEGPYGMSSAAPRLADALARSPNVTVDVGQVMFGQTVTISADTMHQFANVRHARPRKSVLLDIECEAGCGVVPFRYRRRQFVHSLQWAIGLELFLLIDDPRRVFLTTDHPNGGPFTTYPHLIRLLGDRAFRETALAEIHPEAAAASQLGGIDREYDLNELAAMTRAAPAAILGLSDRGTLRPGAIADVVVYRQAADLERMFAAPEYVVRRGHVVRSPGQAGLDREALGRVRTATQVADVPIDFGVHAAFSRRFEEASSFSMRQLWIGDDEFTAQVGGDLQRHAGRERSR